MRFYTKTSAILLIICYIFFEFAIADSIPPEASAPTGSAQTRAVIAQDSITWLDSLELNALYDSLLAGASVRNGSVGDGAKTCQKILNALGEKLTVDGSAGSKTISALNAVLADYCYSQADKLTSHEFDLLMFALAASRDEAFALSVYTDDLQRDVEYAYAAGLARTGLYYSAYQAFRKLELDNFADSSARAAACPQKWPETGELSHGTGYKSKECALVVKTNQPEGSASLIIIRNENGEAASRMFIAGSLSARAMLPHGNYAVYVGTGSVWFGEVEAFGGVAGAAYSRILFSGSAPVMTLEEGYETTLTLDVGEVDEGAMSVWAEGLDLGQFMAGGDAKR